MRYEISGAVRGRGGAGFVERPGAWEWSKCGKKEMRAARGLLAAGPWRWCGPHARVVPRIRDNGGVSLYRDEGVVLRTQKLGEADRIVTLLTRRTGLVRAVGKGVRRTKSRFGARLEPCT